MYRNILVPIDGSATSERGLEEAIRLAQLTKGRLKLLYVIDELSFYTAMDGYALGVGDFPNTLREEGLALLVKAKATVDNAGVPCDTMLCDNLAAQVHEVVVKEAAAWPAGIIVLGTHGRRGVGRIVMGSGAEKILRQSPVPVLLVRAPDMPAAAKESPSESVSGKLQSGVLVVE
jgi:nucleotide-binding universal stress UspA family protein